MRDEDKTKEQLIKELVRIRLRNSKLEKRISEIKIIETELTRLNRLNLVGEMAAVIGHEIRNPITSVRGFLQLFEYKYSQDIDYLNLMVEELDRANDIITEFLSLTRNKIVELKPINLNMIINKISPLICSSATALGNNVEIETGDVPDLYLDEQEIRQLLFNLVRNGLEAMPSGGILTIKTFTEKENVVLSIQDQGNGIDSEILDKFGTPFITTKEQGTGLGLAVSCGIAARHNAKIDVETGPAGSTFYIRFLQTL